MSPVFSVKFWASNFILRNMICVFLRIVVPNAWESLDITLNGSLNLLYVTLIMMIKRPRIIDQVSRSHHFSPASCCSSQYTSPQSQLWWHLRGICTPQRRWWALLLICVSFVNKQISSDDEKSLLGMNWSLGRSDKIINYK